MKRSARICFIVTFKENRVIFTKRMRILFSITIFLLATMASAQRVYEIPPGVTIESGTVLDSASKKAVGNLTLNVSSPGITREIETNVRGLMSLTGDDPTFADGTPENMRFTSATPGYRVTGFSVKTGEHGTLRNERGKKTDEKFWFVEATIYVTKDKSLKSVTIEATVIDSIDRQPRADVSVVLYKENGTKADTAVSDAKGRVTFHCMVPDSTLLAWGNFPIDVEDDQYVFLYIQAGDPQSPTLMRGYIVVRRGVRLIPAGN